LALSDRQATGGGRHLRLSLAGTASWLLHDIRPTPAQGEADTYDPRSWLTETESPYGLLRHALPPVHYDGAPANWNRAPTQWGTDLPNWAQERGKTYSRRMGDRSKGLSQTPVKGCAEQEPR